MKKIALGMTTLALSLMALPSQAQLFKFEHNDTIDAATTVAGLSAGQSAKITIALDNGGSSLNSQTWASSDLQWIEFNFNNGALVTTFTAPFGGVLDFALGSFTTNSSGVLLSVLSTWFDYSIGTDYTYNGAGTVDGWFLGDSPSVYFESANIVAITNGAFINSTESWSAVADAPVPEPTTFALLGLGLAGLAIARKRRAV